MYLFVLSTTIPRNFPTYYHQSNLLIFLALGKAATARCTIAIHTYHLFSSQDFFVSLRESIPVHPPCKESVNNCFLLKDHLFTPPPPKKGVLHFPIFSAFCQFWQTQLWVATQNQRPCILLNFEASDIKFVSY